MIYRDSNEKKSPMTTMNQRMTGKEKEDEERKQARQHDGRFKRSKVDVIVFSLPDFVFSSFFSFSVHHRYRKQIIIKYWKRI